MLFAGHWESWGFERLQEQIGSDMSKERVARQTERVCGEHLLKIEEQPALPPAHHARRGVAQDSLRADWQGLQPLAIAMQRLVYVRRSKLCERNMLFTILARNLAPEYRPFAG